MNNDQCCLCGKERETCQFSFAALALIPRTSTGFVLGAA